MQSIMEGSTGEAKKLDNQSSKHRRLLRIEKIGLGVAADDLLSTRSVFYLYWMLSCISNLDISLCNWTRSKLPIRIPMDLRRTTTGRKTHVVIQQSLSVLRLL